MTIYNYLFLGSDGQTLGSLNSILKINIPDFKHLCNIVYTLSRYYLDVQSNRYVYNCTLYIYKQSCSSMYLGVGYPVITCACSLQGGFNALFTACTVVGPTSNLPKINGRQVLL